MALAPESAKRAVSENRADLAHFEPAFGGDHAVLRVDADNHLTRKAVTNRRGEIRLANRRRADNDVIHTGFDIGSRRFQIANTAADLHRQFRILADDGLDDAGVDRRTRHGAVEIDHMQAPGALFAPLASHRHGVFREYRGLVETALPEPNAFAVFQVNGWYYQHVSRRIMWRRPIAGNCRAGAIQRSGFSLDGTGWRRYCGRRRRKQSPRHKSKRR